MLPLPGTGEILLIALLTFIVFFGEKVGSIGDAIGRLREGNRGKGGEPGTTPRKADGE